MSENHLWKVSSMQACKSVFLIYYIRILIVLCFRNVFIWNAFHKFQYSLFFSTYIFVSFNTFGDQNCWLDRHAWLLPDGLGVDIHSPLRKIANYCVTSRLPFHQCYHQEFPLAVETRDQTTRFCRHLWPLEDIYLLDDSVTRLPVPPSHQIVHLDRRNQNKWDKNEWARFCFKAD